MKFLFSLAMIMAFANSEPATAEVAPSCGSVSRDNSRDWKNYSLWNLAGTGVAATIGSVEVLSGPGAGKILRFQSSQELLLAQFGIGSLAYGLTRTEGGFALYEFSALSTATPQIRLLRNEKLTLQKDRRVQTSPLVWAMLSRDTKSLYMLDDLTVRKVTLSNLLGQQAVAYEKIELQIDLKTTRPVAMVQAAREDGQGDRLWFYLQKLPSENVLEMGNFFVSLDNWSLTLDASDTSVIPPPSGERYIMPFRQRGLARGFWFSSEMTVYDLSVPDYSAKGFSPGAYTRDIDELDGIILLSLFGYETLMINKSDSTTICSMVNEGLESPLLIYQDTNLGRQRVQMGINAEGVLIKTVQFL